MTFVPVLKGPAGFKVYWNPYLWWGGMWITKACKNPVLAAKFLELSISPEWWRLCNLGVQGVHFDVKGEKVILDPYMEARIKDKIADSNTKIVTYDLGWGIGDWSGTSEPNDKLFSQVQAMSSANYKLILDEKAYFKTLPKDEKSIIYDPTWGYVTEDWANLLKLYRDLCAKYFPKMIRGQMDFEQGWTDYLKEFESLGGPKAVENYLNAWEEDQK